MSETITIRGRIATTSLARGQMATVEHTETIDRLIAGGFVEPIYNEGGIVPSSTIQGPDTDDPEQVTEDVSGPVSEDATEGESESATTPRRTPRKKKSS